MSDQQMPFQRLDSYVAARELARRIHTAKVRDVELRDQATRAAKSVFLNLCEGLPHEGVAMRRRYFATALGSLHEAVGIGHLVDDRVVRAIREAWPWVVGEAVAGAEDAGAPGR
jgi:four helix bundle protein